jgi:hypothetical protein
MNRTDVSPTALIASPASYPDYRPARRLIVLVPEFLEDSSITAGKIWELAKALEGHVLFIGLCKDAALEPSLRRQFVFLSAMVSDGFVSVETKIEVGGNWLKVIKSNWRDGDVLVCFAGQYTGLMHRPLSQLISSNLKLNVFVLDDLFSTNSHRPNWLSPIMAWVGSISIIAVFFWAQVQINHLPEVWAQNVLMYLSIPLEVGLIWGWNTLFP